MEYQGINYLRAKLNQVQPRVNLRYRQYDMKHRGPLKGLTVPPSLAQQYQATLGWCAKAVDALADRLVFREFSNDVLGLNDIFKENNPDIFFDSAILSALIASCCFVYISKGEDGAARLQVIDAANATGILDPITGMLIEGYAVLERNKEGSPITEAYFIPGETVIYRKGLPPEYIPNKARYALLVPVIHRPDAVRPFGRSRITRAAMYYQEYAKRTLERSDITAEFYSFPQKYVVGLSQDAEPLDTWKATISSMLQFTKDADGDKPTLGQFTQPSMSPFTEQLRTIAASFAGETGLTLDDLGFVSDNPSSSEAIKASHETLRVMAKKAQRCFGSAFLNVGYLSVCLQDNKSYLRGAFMDSVPKWHPVFEPDAATLSLVGDGAIKINQAIPGYFTQENLVDLMGIKGGEIEDGF